MLTLHYVSEGSASCRVRFLLAEKHVQYEARIIDIQGGENLSAEYLRLNPNGLVPTLVHNGRPIWESAVICEYLEDILPTPRLRPEAAYERSLMRNWVKYIDEHCLPAMIVINWSVRAAFASKWTEAELQARLARTPTSARRATWQRAARDPWSQGEREAALKTFEELARRMSDVLASKPWLIGEEFSIADITAATYVRRIEAVLPELMNRANMKPLLLWWLRIKRRAGYSVAYDL